MRRKKKISRKAVICIICLLCFDFFIIGIVVGMIIDPAAVYSGSMLALGSNGTKMDIIKNCYNLSLYSASSCLAYNINGFYNYNESNVGVEMTFDELKEYGGVCSHYAELYVELGRMLGFYGRVVVIEIAHGRAHAVAILSDKEGYCLLDQLEYVCYSIV